MSLRDVFRGAPLGKLAQDVEDVCQLADEALDNALGPTSSPELRAMVERVRTVVPPALRRLHEIHQGVEGLFDSIRKK